MSLEQIYIINMGFHFLVYLILTKLWAISLLKIKIYCLHYLHGLGQLAFPVSKKDTVLLFVGRVFHIFFQFITCMFYVYINPFTTTYIMIRMSKRTKIL